MKLVDLLVALASRRARRALKKAVPQERFEDEVITLASKLAALSPAVPRLGEELAQIDGNLIANELDTFAELPRSFTFRELAAFVDSEIGRNDLLSALVNDSRFIELAEVRSDERLFIPDKALFRWFSSFTMRLAQAKQSRLSAYQLAGLMSSLRVEGRWQVPPARALEFGQRFGFVGPAWTAGEYVFPLAHVLSFVSPSLRDLATVGLQTMRKTQAESPRLVDALESAIEEALSRFGERMAYIVKGREGLLGGKKLTLEELGQSRGLTRERVRQLEAKFWKRGNPSAAQKKVASFLFPALLRTIGTRHGRLTFVPKSLEGPLLQFIAKCLGIPSVDVPGTRLAIVGASEEEIAAFKSLHSFPHDTDVDWVATQMEAKGRVPLVRSDVEELAHDHVALRKSRLTKGQKVYLALRSIGRPAHYSGVAQAYNAMFPERPMTEHNIHAVLSREQHGVVWVGLRGAFALKEWGYERPSKRLFDAVAEIVQERYTETSRPVPFTVITAEIGKYRQIVNPSSLTFAAHCNPCLRRIGKDSFVPIDPADEAQEEVSAAELDRILREFESEKSQ